MTWSLSIGVFRNYDNLIRHAGGLMMTEIKISGWTQEIWEGSCSKGTRVIQRLSDFVRITTECRGLCSVRCVPRCWRCQRLFLADSAGRDSGGSSVKEITLIGSSGERISAGKGSGKRKGTVLNDRPRWTDQSVVFKIAVWYCVCVFFKVLLLLCVLFLYAGVCTVCLTGTVLWKGISTCDHKV